MVEKELHYRLERIVPLNFEVIEHSEFNILDYLGSSNVHYNLIASTIPKVDDDTLFLDLELDSQLKLDENQYKLYKIKIRYVFSIKGINNFVNDGYLEIPRNYKITFFNMSYSALRGILFEKLSPYRYKDLLLPMIDSYQAIPDDHKIRIPYQEDNEELK